MAASVNVMRNEIKLKLIFKLRFRFKVKVRISDVLL